MPIFKNNSVLEIKGRVRVFLNLEVGLALGGTPGSGTPGSGARARDPSSATGEGREQEGSEGLQRGPAGHPGGVSPENIVWIFGAGRTGSTWLAKMMNEMPQTSFWNEPMVGRLFGAFYEGAQEGQRGSRGFVLGEPARDGWLPLLREFVLGSAGYRYPELGDGFLIVKEPNGSIGAPLLAEALPESRMVLLIRDPRDVAASVLDGARKGGWLYERKRGKRREESLADTDPDALVRNTARQYLKNVSGSRKAFEAHAGPKAFVEYEDLRADPLERMRRLYRELRLPVDEEELRRVVERHSWENIPEKEKGEGKKFRKARPGGWREDLTPAQIRIVEEATAPLLGEFYPEGQISRT